MKYFFLLTSLVAGLLLTSCVNAQTEQDDEKAFQGANQQRAFPLVQGQQGRRAIQQPGAQQPGAQQPAIQQPGTTVQPYVAPGAGSSIYPSPHYSCVRLGFTGVFIPGQGIQILSVNSYGLAARYGLESGDIIRRVNNVMVASSSHFDQLLANAIYYHYGHVDLMVRDVRFDWGMSYQEFVTVHMQLPAAPMGCGIGGPVIH